MHLASFSGCESKVARTTTKDISPRHAQLRCEVCGHVPVCSDMKDDLSSPGSQGSGTNRSSTSRSPTLPRSARARVHLRRAFRALGPPMSRPTWKEALRAAVGAGLGLALCGAFLVTVGAWVGAAPGLLLIAPLGATAFLVFAVPNSPLAQPWSAVAGNGASAFVAVNVLHLGLPIELAAGPVGRRRDRSHGPAARHAPARRSRGIGDSAVTSAVRQPWLRFRARAGHARYSGAGRDRGALQLVYGSTLSFPPACHIGTECPRRFSAGTAARIERG